MVENFIPSVLARYRQQIVFPILRLFLSVLMSLDNQYAVNEVSITKTSVAWCREDSVLYLLWYDAKVLQMSYSSCCHVEKSARHTWDIPRSNFAVQDEERFTPPSAGNGELILLNYNQARKG